MIHYSKNSDYPPKTVPDTRDTGHDREGSGWDK